MNRTIQLRQQKEREILLEHLKKTPIVQLACEKSGVGRATYYRWRKEDSDFAKKAERAIQKGVLLMNDFAESQLISSIRDKNMTAIIYWLKHRHGAYSTRLEVTGSLEHKNIEIPEEYRKLIKKAVKVTALESESKDE